MLRIVLIRQLQNYNISGGFRLASMVLCMHENGALANFRFLFVCFVFFIKALSKVITQVSTVVIRVNVGE